MLSFISPAYAPAARVSLAYLLNIFLLGGLVSLYPHAMFDTSFSSSRNRAQAPSYYITQDNPEFSWEMISPERNLFGENVTQNSLRPSDRPSKLFRSIGCRIRKASTFAESSREYKGPILFNPGGPWLSGMGLIRKFRDAFSSGRFTFNASCRLF
jgi:hypothetical protein